MNIVIVAFGSYGDILPMLTLSKSLCANGHSVKVIASPNYQSMFRSEGFTFYPVGFDFNKLMNQESKRIYNNPFGLLRSFRKIYRTFLLQQFYGLLEIVTENTELIIGSGISIAVRSVAELRRTRYYQICYYPVTFESRFFTPTIVESQNLPSIVNSFLWKSQNLFLMSLFGKSLNELRRIYKLPRVKNIVGHLTENSVLACNRELILLPDDISVSFFHTCYIFNRKDDVIIENRISAFINRSEPPIFIGFGSMTDSNPSKTKKLVDQLLTQTNYRYVISRGWTNAFKIEESERLIVVDNIPYTWLFPKMSIIVHHGGAGTCHEAARSGVPQIIVPHMIDQFYWGHRLADLGIASRPIPRKILSARRLIQALDFIHGSQIISDKAKTIAMLIEKNSDIQPLVKFLENETKIKEGDI